MKPLIAFSIFLTFALSALAEDLTAPRQQLERQIAALPVMAHFDQAYAGTDNPKQRLDLFLPKERKSEKPLPVIVFIHGGAWAREDRVFSASKVLNFVRSGDYASVTVSYRLSGEAKWPAQIHDTKAAIRWVRGNAAKFGLDPERVGVMGSSAGGHLVSLLGTSGGVQALEGDLGEYTAQSSRVSCVVNLWGPQDFTLPLMFKDGAPVIEDPAVADLLGGPLAENHDQVLAASPVTYVSEDDPPFLTLHGTKDPRVDFKHAERLHAALTAAAVPSLLIPILDGGHGPQAPEMPERIRAFFDKHLRGLDADLSSAPLHATQNP
ncbi:MAG: alpha/beta hydrolase [Prosthecobacter sp.]|nr:alpha/beta hydrolase [Prosthecobacter sp.]